MQNAELRYFASQNVLKMIDNARKNEPGTKGALPDGRCSDLSEWPGSVSDAAALSARRTPGTATGRPYTKRSFVILNEMQWSEESVFLVKFQAGGLK